MLLDGLVIQLDPKSYRERHFSGHVSGSLLSLPPEEMVLPDPVAVDITVSRAKDQWRVSGTLAYQGRYVCSRCLEVFVREQSSHMERLFCVGVDPAHNHKIQGIEDEQTFLPSSELTIQDLVREELLLDLPMMPVCSDDCRGLCPQCGCNRNHERCHCEDNTREGPFSRLKELKLS
ncbi:MAG: DUF177 domain-containing protein [Magnetococcales bacterium]|nr:DUF177 domain-containing protein [Magnetococcales bacterium]